MVHTPQMMRILTLAAAACWTLSWGHDAAAQSDFSTSVEQPAEQLEALPAMPSDATPVEALPVFMPQEELAPPQDGIVVHPVAEIDYDVTRRARRRFAGSPFVELSMVTKNPADCCFYEIPLCLPACCTGEPQVTSYRGLLGRGVVKYCYECGLEVTVKFRLRGDVEVTYGV